jgi:hypothetical protein
MPTNNAWNSNVPVEIAKGGTNATSMTNTDGVCYFDGTRLVTTTVGNATEVLTSNGAAVAPTFQARIPPTGNYGFRAKLATAMDNVTGRGEDVTIIFDDELFDYGANYNAATGEYTAPITGLYHFSAAGILTGNLISTTGTFYISPGVGSNLYTIQSRVGASSNSYAFTLSGILALTAGQKVTVHIVSSGEAATTTDISAATEATFFCGYFIS